MTKLVYLQYGCGFSVGRNWINYDNSPTLRVQRVPFAGPLILKAAKIAKFPADVRHGDICNKMLAPPQSCAGIYASHVLEHLSLEDFRIAIARTFDMLAPGGTFRLVVPDLLEWSKRYALQVEAGSVEANSWFIELTCLGVRRRPRGLVGLIRQYFGNSQHLWMWDEPSMTHELRKAGFTNVRRCEFNDAEDPMFKEVEDLARFRHIDSGINELAVECKRPAASDQSAV